MKFKALQENLRKALWARIDGGDLTGLRLAELTGFKQAHISNFLNRKRGLSLEGMDKVLRAQKLSVLDLLDPEEINKRASILPPSEDEFENVLLVNEAVAIEPLILNMDVQEKLKFKKSFLQGLRSETEGDRDHWERVVAIKVDGREGVSMYPRLLPGAIVLIDRRYNSLKPYRRGECNMYAVNKNGACTVKYVELAENHLVLRPHNQACPVELLLREEGRKAHDYLVGRVCHVGIET